MLYSARLLARSECLDVDNIITALEIEHVWHQSIGYSFEKIRGLVMAIFWQAGPSWHPTSERLERSGGTAECASHAKLVNV